MGNIPSFIDEFPMVMEAIKSMNGTPPIFLYRKKLQGSDVEKGQNRIFLTKSESLVHFLNEAEAAAVDSRGLKILGLDQQGKPYNLRLNKWRSLNMLVIDSAWNNLVAANNAKEGDSVQIWGFRHDDDAKLALAVVFIGIK